MSPRVRRLPCTTRLHLQHGPIDLVIGADGARDRAFEAAAARFATILDDLVSELPRLRRAVSAGAERPRGHTARRMHAAALAHLPGFVTPMAGVAGAVADEILAAMIEGADLRRAYVNNGGDIAVYLRQGARFDLAMRGHDNADLGRVRLRAGQGVGGIATSGRHGRSHSLGIADSVTVLAQSAVEADVAATLIANAVDLPAHPGVVRRPANELDPDSDLGRRAVVTGCTWLPEDDVARALEAGFVRADVMVRRGLIAGAALFLQGQARATGGLMKTGACARVEEETP